jgi:Fe2+ or Zn2+ uptake regulation protein
MTYDTKQITPELTSLSVASTRRVDGIRTSTWHLHCSTCGDVTEVPEADLDTITECPSPRHIG